MLSGGVEPREVDSVVITTLIDNYTDVLLQSTEAAERPPIARGDHIAKAPLAEHGLSILIRIVKGNEVHTVLLDAGLSALGVPYNLNVFGIDLNELEAVVISHGHMDHFGALERILSTRKKLPVVLHPHAFASSRGGRSPDGRMYKFPLLSEQGLREAGAEVVKTEVPYPIASGLAWTTGEIKRVTDFEKGSPNLWVERNGQVQHDPVIDDQGIVIHRKGKGLIVVSGCAHAGIINMIKHAQSMTGIHRVHAVVGGFHLPSPSFRPILDRTIQELKAISPEMVIPTHCTGWEATMKIAQEMPSQFVLSSVGTKFVF